MSRLATAALVVALAGSAAAQQAPPPKGAAGDADVDLIPDAALQSAAPGAPAAPARTSVPPLRGSVEAAAQALGWRSDPVLRAPGQDDPRTRLRTSLDLRAEGTLAPGLRGVLAHRFDLVLSEGQAVDDEHLQGSLREAYLSYRLAPDLHLDLGRVNQKDGAALGFNPADAFKANAVKVRVSEDPSVLRDARLGTVMLRGQALWDGGAIAALYAPRLDDGRGPPESLSLSPGLDRTNRQHRGQLKASQRLAQDLQPEVIVTFAEQESPRFGLSLTRAFGDAVVGYAEWSGGRRRGLVAQALREGERRRDLPPGTRPLVPSDTGEAVRSQAAIGLSLTTGFKLTMNAEYHFNEGGLTRSDWRRWVEAARASPLANGQFWLLRRFAGEGLEPVVRDSLFLRASWQEAFLRDLDLAALARINVYDGSAFAQVEAAYYLTGATTLTLTGNANFGHRTSELGTLRQHGSVQVKLTQHF
ncbi:MAG: hypothetical protein JNK11_20585 [Alphaproteobacteria bacterium]|nr:hypothetical protein [Alphaproteobacteria bacterium]